MHRGRYYLITYGKHSGLIIAVSRPMSYASAVRAARNTDHYVDIVAAYIT